MLINAHTRTCGHSARHGLPQSGVYVGSECWKLIQAAGDAGYQPPTGGPKLYPDPPSRPLTLDDFFPEESCGGR